MNYWEDFFSLDYIVYPIVLAIVGGLLSLILTTSMGFKEQQDLCMYIFSALGFIGGNILKVKKIQAHKPKPRSRSRKK